MKQVILNNWNLMRFLRLGLGIFIFIQSIITRNWTMAVLGIVFISMPLFNIGCCGTGGCIAPAKNNSETPKEISYEEVV